MANPIPGWTRMRDDQGVDANSPVGTPFFAPAGIRRVQGAIPGWEPYLYLFEFVPHLNNTPYGCQYFYVAEGITPPTAASYRAGQIMCRSTATSIETGWGSLTAGARTLAAQEGDPEAANPPAGSSTFWGESFAKYFGIQPIGQSGKGGKGRYQVGGGGGGGSSTPEDTFTAGKQLFSNYLTLRDMPRNQGSETKFTPPFQQNLQELWATSVAGSTTSAAQKAVKGILGAIGALGGKDNKSGGDTRGGAPPIRPRIYPRGGIGNRNG